jgi:hypothetical protein
MSNITERISGDRLSIERILLDPNNPRLFGVRETASDVEDSRIPDESVQTSVLVKMKNPRFHIKELKQSIRQIGFLPLDKIVVRAVADTESFVVVEGNRRVAAIKWLLEDHNSGEDTLGNDFLERVSMLDVLVLETTLEELDQDRYLLQGVRHISGVQEWGPYEQALSVKSMIEDQGLAPREAAEALGTTTHKVNKLYRALGTFEQFEDDGDFGEYADPDSFSYFVEAVGKPKIKTYLGWDEGSRTFNDDDNRYTFYSWITPNEEGVKKLPMAIDVRKLATIVENTRALQILASPGGTLEAALATLSVGEKFDWRIHVTKALDALDNIPASDLESPEEEDTLSLQRLIDLAERRLGQFSRPQAEDGSDD